MRSPSTTAGYSGGQTADGGLAARQRTGEEEGGKTEWKPGSRSQRRLCNCSRRSYLPFPQHDPPAMHRLPRLALPLAPASEGEFAEERFVGGGGVGAALFLDGEGDAGGGGDAGEGEEADDHRGDEEGWGGGKVGLQW